MCGISIYLSVIFLHNRSPASSKQRENDGGEQSAVSLPSKASEYHSHQRGAEEEQPKSPASAKIGKHGRSALGAFFRRKAEGSGPHNFPRTGRRGRSQPAPEPEPGRRDASR